MINTIYTVLLHWIGDNDDQKLPHMICLSTSVSWEEHELSIIVYKTTHPLYRKYNKVNVKMSHC